MKIEYDDHLQQHVNRAMSLLLRTDLLTVLNGGEDADLLLYEAPSSQEREGVVRLINMVKAIEDERSVANKKIEAINQILESCTVHPYISKTPKGKLAVHDRVTEGASNSVHAAIRAVVYLIREGHLDLLNLCECGRWYLAGRRGQASCSTQCYQRRYQATEDAKRKRREYDEGLRTGKYVPKVKRVGKARSAHGKA